MLTLAGLFIYPIKSCRGAAVAGAELTWAGLLHDREWMAVTPEGRFVTQRELPRLALVAPDLQPGTLVVTAPAMEPLLLPLDDRSGARREVVVWRDRCEAIDAGAAAAAWFSAFLGRPLRLVRFDPSRRRRTDPQWSGGLDGETRFTDGFPLLVLSRASFDDLNARLPASLPLDRFRPNLLLEGCEPYAEDDMSELTAGAATIRVVKPCIRCIVTTTDQATAERDGGEEPLRTLRTYRWNAKLHGVAFAQNAIVASGAPTELRVGTPLHATWKPGSDPGFKFGRRGPAASRE